MQAGLACLHIGSTFAFIIIGLAWCELAAQQRPRERRAALIRYCR
jgi:hypothetical protein